MCERLNQIPRSLGLFAGLTLRCSDPPVNCTFGIYDINDGVGPYANGFDVVHGRAIVSGVRGYCNYLRTIGGMLRSGGVYLGAEVDWRRYTETGQVINAMSEDEPVRHTRSHMALYEWF